MHTRRCGRDARGAAKSSSAAGDPNPNPNPDSLVSASRAPSRDLTLILTLYLTPLLTRCCVIEASRDLQAGDELLMSYGEMSTTEFVVKFGHVPESLVAEIMLARILNHNPYP